MSHCAPGKGDDKTCFSHDQLKKIATAYNTSVAKNPSDHIRVNQPKYALWEDIRRHLAQDCDQEYCWVDKKFVKNIRDPEMLYNTFKPKRPLGKYQWLTTSNIHEVMKQYEFMYKDFVFLGPVPMDFYDVMPEIGNVDVAKLYRKGIRRIGFVFNTDPSDKPGKHWISMFVTLYPDNPSISFFDSFAICPPPPQVQRLIAHISGYAEQLYGSDGKFTVNCNMVKHQYANSECGVYSIYFITESLKGRAFNQIAGNIVRDEQINQRRDIYFRPSE